MKRALISIGVFVLTIGAWLSALAQFTPTTIADLQNGLHSEGAQLEVTGIVSATRSDHVYVQDAAAVRSGVRCYGGGYSISGINIGDNVTVQAVYEEYYGETELNFSVTGSIAVNSTGNTPYTALAVTGASFPFDGAADTSPAEDYEGVLVRVTNVTITDDTSPGHGMVEGTDDGGAHTLRFDDGYITVVGVLEVGKTYNITGIGRYDFSDYKILPRYPADIVDLSSVDDWTSY